MSRHGKAPVHGSPRYGQNHDTELLDKKQQARHRLASGRLHCGEVTATGVRGVWAASGLCRPRLDARAATAPGAAEAGLPLSPGRGAERTDRHGGREEAAADAKRTRERQSEPPPGEGGGTGQASPDRGASAADRPIISALMGARTFSSPQMNDRAMRASLSGRILGTCAMFSP